ncbi:class I SAM-dependent methyltransferase [Mycobacterium deserti]|uniref:Class I SAM-dependent methyltransferase n=1 Tax=Mycobacterium deserti TaxID=2978347 RepID=A0ABT2MHQ1_9MYCO|nr:class I SAM-dependent methyltransferase [Mycobacterium deserti]MCT7661803.1 class I SAM-dependent methyltransferase [Mycobacterium deserti]
MTEHHPRSVTGTLRNRHDYLPAAGHDLLLPGYDLLTRALGMTKGYATLIEQARLADGMSVLEVGCGTGSVISRAKRTRPGIDAVGSDPDPRALARAQRKARNLGIKFDRGYIQKLPYRDGQFDRVLSSMMWHHLDEDVKAEAAQEIFRVLRPGGELHLVDIGGDMSADDGLLARRMMHGPHAQGNLGDAIPRRLNSAGFDCTPVATHRLRLIGRVTFFRAVKPA